MWQFAVGIYFISLNPTNLQGVAVNGIALNLAVIFFGAAIGDWIDRSPRVYQVKNIYIFFRFHLIFFSTSKGIIYPKFICCFNGCISCYCFI
jgi:hypothetical protein